MLDVKVDVVDRGINISMDIPFFVSMHDLNSSGLVCSKKLCYVIQLLQMCNILDTAIHIVITLASGMVFVNPYE